MNVWVVIKSGFKDESGIIVNFTEHAFTSLKAACESESLNYSAASKGKRLFVKIGTVFLLKQLNVQKIKGRENNHKRKIKNQ